MHLSSAVLRWMLVDLGGLALLVLGGTWLALDLAIVPGVPTSSGQAWFCVGLGLTLIGYAVVEILKEFLTQQSAVSNVPDSAANVRAIVREVANSRRGAGRPTDDQV